MDESGDLGFNWKKKPSRFFIITCIATSDRKPIEKLVKKTHTLLRKRVKKLSGGILHANKEKPVTRKRLLSGFAKTKCSVMTIYMDKKKVYAPLQNEKHVLYNYVTNILIDRILRKKIIDNRGKVVLIASKRETNIFLNENFVAYLTNQTLKNHKIQIHIEIKTPSQEKGLQAVDFVSWSIFRKFEFQDRTYYAMIKDKIVEENGLFTS